MANFRYPALVEPNGEGGFIASFRDVPEALTEAPSLEELKTMARDALITAIDFYIERHRAFPAASSPEEGEMIISLPPSVVAKVLLLNAMVEQNVRPSDLARKLGLRRQDITRLTDIHHSTKIDTIGEALYALGKDLVITAS